MRLDEICNFQKTVINDNCFKVLEVKTKASQRIIPIHPLLKHLIERLWILKKKFFYQGNKKVVERQQTLMELSKGTR